MPTDSYLAIARSVAALSKDTSTQAGALIIGSAKEIRAIGYNGAPRGCAADEPNDPRNTRPEKYHWFSHAELNAITNAARVGTPLEGTTILTTHFPCTDCARAIVQSGIVRVVSVAPEGGFLERWGESISRSKALFEECGVELVLL